MTLPPVATSRRIEGLLHDSSGALKLPYIPSQDSADRQIRCVNTSMSRGNAKTFSKHGRIKLQTERASLESVVRRTRCWFVKLVARRL
jgi:hypothetical protein